MKNQKENEFLENKQLAEEIIDLFIARENIDVIAKELNQEMEFVRFVLDYKKMIIKCFGEEKWNKVEIRKNEIIKKEKLELKEAQYQQTMQNIIFYILNSLYNFNEIAEHVFCSKKVVQDMIYNTDYISKVFGEEMLTKVKKAIELRKTVLKSVKRNNVKVVKDPKYRELVNPNVLIVDTYQFSLIEKVYLFFECDGYSEKVLTKDSTYYLNDIITSLQDKKLEELLLPTVYKKLKQLLDIDIILTQNRLDDRKKLVEKVVLLTYNERGNIENLTETLELPVSVIERILKDPYVKFVCKKIDIDPSLIVLKKYNDFEKLIIDVANYIIENKASYSKAAKEFGISKTTVGEYMKDRLPAISKKKSIKVNEIIRSNASSNELSEETSERILLEYDLLMRGYNLKQVAYLTGNTYSRTQRDLSKRLQTISEEKSELANQKLEYNKSKIYRKN